MIERFTARIELARVTGHYAARTSPDELAADIRRFFGHLCPLPVRSSN